MNILRDFPNDYYLETGSYRGDSLQFAIDAGCFKQIIGLDIDYEMVRFCKDRFDLYRFPRPELRVYECDSAVELTMHMRNIEKPATIFLDAHWQMFAGTDKGKHPFPLLDELKQIESLGRTKDTIIIDDFLYMTHPEVTGWNRKKIFDALYKINPKYTIRLTSNPIIDNLLIAIP